MDTLSHDGLTYVKATILAKQFHYTTDYIGQLCRQGKVEAQLVGRAWFVTERSLTAHKNDRHKDTRPAEIMSKNRVNHVTVIGEKRSVYPVLTKRMHRQLADSAGFTMPTAQTHFGKRIATYSADEGSLHPEMVKPRVSTVSTSAPVPVPVALGEPTQMVRVRKEGKASSVLEFSPLPEVSLRGVLSVSSLDTEDEYLDPEPVVTLPRPVVSEPVYLDPRPAVSIRPVTLTHHLNAVPVTRVAEVVMPAVPAPALTSAPQSAVRLQTAPRFFIPMMLLLSVVLTGVLFALTTHLESTGSSLTQGVSFSLVRVFEVIHFYY